MNTGFTGSGLPRTTTRPLPLANIAIPVQVIDMHLTRIANSITQPKTIQPKAQTASLITSSVVPQYASSFDVILQQKQLSLLNPVPKPQAKPRKIVPIILNSPVSSTLQRPSDLLNGTERKTAAKQSVHKKNCNESHEKPVIPDQPDFWLPIRILRPNLPHLVQHSSGHWQPAVDAQADEEDIQLLTELVFTLQNLKAPKEDLTLMRLDFLAQDNWIEHRELTEQEQQQLNIEYKSNMIAKPIIDTYANEGQSSYSLTKPALPSNLKNPPSILKKPPSILKKPPSILKKPKPRDIAKLYRTEKSPRKVKYHFDQVLEKVRFFNAEPNSGTLFHKDMPAQMIAPLCVEDKASEEINLQN